MHKEDKIVILGVTGYTGSWLAKQLVEAGYMNIVGSYQNEEKMNYLEAQFPSITGVEVDLLNDPDALQQILQGAKWVFNNSAPFTGEEKTMDDFVQTKLHMVDQLFTAINMSQTVEKLVHLGSAASVAFGLQDPEIKVIDEDIWNDVEGLDYPYERFVVMKTYEENRIWELAKVSALDVSILHPTNIIGPSVTPWHHDMIYANLHGSKYTVNGPMDCIDVRDLTAAEIALMNNEESSGKRVLGIGFSISKQDLVDITKETLNEEEIQLVFENDLPEVVPVDLALALWKSIQYTSFYKDHANRLVHHSVLKTKYPELYTYQYTDGKQSIVEALHKMLDDKNRNYKKYI